MINKIVEETEQLFKDYSDVRDKWATMVQEDVEFRYGKQWRDEDMQKLIDRGQAPVVVNRVHPAVEAAKAMLTANRPSFRVSPREDSDNETAQAINGLLQYIWQFNDGDSMMRSIIDDYYVRSMGVGYVHVDPSKDMGKGEICIIDVDPLTVYIDPTSKNRYCDDAQNIIISELVTKGSLKHMYPTKISQIEGAASSNESDMPVTTLASTEELIFPEDSTIMSANKDSEYVRKYIRFQKVIKPFYRVFDRVSGIEDMLNKDSFTEYVKQPAWIIDGQIYTSEASAQQAIQMAQQQAMAAAQQQDQQMNDAAQQQADATGQPIQYEAPAPREPQIQQITFEDLIQMGQINVVEVKQSVIRQVIIIGQTVLYDGILEIDKYPLIFFMNLHNRTPYPISDVRMVRSLQEEINKTRSLIIAHATTSTTNKLIIQTGAADIGELEDKWASPSGIIEADLQAGEFQVVHPAPLPGELYQKENIAKSDIDHQMGLYEFMMGNSQAAPQTYKATISLDEFGQRRIKSKLMDIESGLKRMGEVVIAMMQKLYTTEKIVRVIQPNNSMSEYMVNKRMYDDYGRVVETVNNIAVGKYDVIVVTGSTLPSNRFAQLEFYMEAYKVGLIDRQEVLKKTEIFDQEGVMQRMDTIAQLEQQVQQLQEELKQVSGDLQTREREAMHAKQEASMARFDADLSKNKTAIEHSTRMYSERLQDEQKMNKERNALDRQKQNTRDTRKKAAPKG